MTEEKLKITRANNLKLYNINKDSALIFLYQCTIDFISAL